MQHEHIRMGTLVVLVIACSILAALMNLNIVTMTANDESTMNAARLAALRRHGRVTAFGANPNSIASILALGILALIGLVFGGERRSIKARLLALAGLGSLAIALVRTGTRGAIIAIMAGLFVFLLKSKNVSPRLKSWAKKSRLKIGLIVLGLIGFVVIISYQYEPVRARWAPFLTEGSLGARESIYTEGFGMFLERPWLGWGPATFLFELGTRLGLPTRDPHNAYLWVLLETGILGAVPFFCWPVALLPEGMEGAW